MALSLVFTPYSFTHPFKEQSLGSNYMVNIVIIDLGKITL